MNALLRYVMLAVLAAAVSVSSLEAQTDGKATLRVTLKDYSGTSGTKHWTVVWVTTASGTFIKTLRKQGPTITSSHWSSHCGTWHTAKGGSTALDGYSSATAQDYAGTNSPVILTWNGRDASGNLMPDGDYKFWVQYAEDKGQGPYTTSGLTWTKGPSAATKTFPDQGANFASMRVEWNPIITAPTAINSARLEGGNMVITGGGAPNQQFLLLGSPDLGQPASQWTTVSTNKAAADGSFTISIGVSEAAQQNYYRLRSP